MTISAQENTDRIRAIYLEKRTNKAERFPPIPAGYMSHRTQKAAGIALCRYISSALGIHRPSGAMLVFPSSQTDDRYHVSAVTFPMFARPCPSRPRHGFVDSVEVDDWPTAIRLLQKATVADEFGAAQLVLMEKQSAEISAVSTNAGVTWGRGHDGVTGGADPKCKFIPAPSLDPEIHAAAFLDAVSLLRGGNKVAASASALIENSLYLELVSNHNVMSVVQMRDGPPQTTEPDFIPRSTFVDYVLRAADFPDLMTYEKKVKAAQLEHREGSMIIDCHNMPLSSHYAVHGIERGVPVITSHEPLVGAAYVPTKNVPREMSKRELKSLARHIKAGLSSRNLMSTNPDQRREQVLTAVATVHAQPLWNPEPHLQTLRGRMVSTLITAGLAGVIGELRHWFNSSGPYGRYIERHNDDGFGDCGACYADAAPQPTFRIIDVEGHARGNVYNKTFAARWSFRRLKTALKALNVDMHADWEGGYGGHKWGDVVDGIDQLRKAAEIFVKAPTNKRWAGVSTAANNLVHISHNGGKCLNKWADSRTLDALAIAPGLGFLNAFCGMVALGLRKGAWDVHRLKERINSADRTITKLKECGRLIDVGTEAEEVG